ncbi:MAG TPA: protein-L-isoaspartate(D-aspartate) O-methyltransferase [Terriglobales bacterium]|nr:protein-L-isoaspartate(D-aspartate) O-methyltransferase [Terriglobales bacterium]
MSINGPTESYSAERARMVEEQLRGRGIRDERVLRAMLQVPRHEFVPENYRAQSYGDHPIPIGENQTISQPFIIAVSLQALALQGPENVLEVGTGSGYQTALLAQLARQVYSMERHPSLAHGAETVLAWLGLKNVRVVVGDGSQGLREYAPFDAILVSAAAPSVPKSLLDQLSESGRMVIPVGPPHAQELLLVEKRDGRLSMQAIEGCRFVPLVGAEGY